MAGSKTRVSRWVMMVTRLIRLFANTAQAIANLGTFQAQARRAAVVPGS